MQSLGQWRRRQNAVCHDAKEKIQLVGYLSHRKNVDSLSEIPIKHELSLSRSQKNNVDINEYSWLVILAIVNQGFT